MWLFTIYGFFSVAAVKNIRVIRARDKQHLIVLRQRFPGLRRYTIHKTPDRDYAFRMIVDVAVWSGCVRVLVEEQTWTNFKNEVGKRRPKDKAYRDALHDTWIAVYGAFRPRQDVIEPGEGAIEEAMERYR